MKTINLKKYYPFIEEDQFVCATDEVANLLEKTRQAEVSYERKLRRYNAVYSLDYDCSLESRAVFASETPETLFEWRLTLDQLYAALLSLPDKQSNRIHAHFFWDMSFTEIALAEGVDESSIRESIDRGLKNLEKYLEVFI